MAKAAKKLAFHKETLHNLGSPLSYTTITLPEPWPTSGEYTCICAV